MGEHAYLSPSSTFMSFNCPASTRRSEVVDRRANLLRQAGAEFYGLDDAKASQFNAILEDTNTSSSDGSYLHKVFEDCLIAKVTDEDRISSMIDGSGASEDVTEDDFIRERMIDACVTWVTRAELADKRYAEKRIKVKGLPQFGTVDLVMITDRHLEIWDLKTGRNQVEADNNYQLLCYAVGMLDELGWDKYDEVTMGIIGIRFSNSEVTVPVDDIMKFKMDIMLPAFFKAYSINPEAIPGKWCHYCSAKMHCKEWLEDNDRTFSGVFMEDMSELSNEELENLFFKFQDIEQLIKSEVKPELMLRFDTFDEPTGVIRVNGRTDVKWSVSDEEVEGTLKEVVDDVDELYKRTIKTPKQVEKLLGDKAEVIEQLVVKTTRSPYIKRK